MTVSIGSIGTDEPVRYPILVESIEMPSDADIRAAYEYVWVNRSWRRSAYDVLLHESLREVRPTVGEKTVLLLKLFRPLDAEAFDWAEKNDCRVLFPWERETFARANPGLQLLSHVVDLGSHVFDGRDSTVPVLGQQGGRRALRYEYRHIAWRPNATHYYLFTPR